MLICVTGLPASGKSSLTELIKSALQNKSIKISHYNLDWIRFKLFPELVGKPELRGRDFTPDELERSYNGLYMLVDQVLASSKKQWIISDGTFRRHSQREALRKIAQENKIKFTLIWVQSKEDLIVPRSEKRVAIGKGAGPESYFSAKSQYESPEKENPIIITNNGSLEDLTIQVNKLIDQLIHD